MSGSAKKKRGEISPQHFVSQTRETRAVFKIPKKKFRKRNKAARNLEQMKFNFNFDERETFENILKTHCL